MRAVLGEHAAADDHRRTRSLAERFEDDVGQLGQQRRVIAQPFDLVGQVHFRADREQLGPALDRLADAGVHQRRFPAQVGADQQDDVRRLQIGERRVEHDRRQARHIIGKAGLPTFQHRAAQLLDQQLASEHRLAIEQVAGDRRHAAAMLDSGDRLERFFPGRRHQLAILADERLVEPLAHQAIDIVPGLVRRPFLVHVIIDARHGAQHLATAAVEADVGADRIHHVDRVGLLQFPRPRFERIGLGRQRADGAEIDDIARQLALGGMLEIGRDLHILAAIDGADFRHARDFLGKAHAAGALDAAGHDRLDDRTHIFLGDGALVFLEAAAAPAIGDRLVLQVAFATLVADRAVERVVDEQELHHPFARLLHHFGLGEDFLIVGGRQRAAGLRLGRSGLHLDQAHAAIAGDGQALMVAEAGDFLPRQLAGLQDGRARRHFEFYAVDFDFRHWDDPGIDSSSARRPRRTSQETGHSPR